MVALGDQSFEQIAAILSQTDPDAVSNVGWEWSTMQQALQELSTALRSHGVSLLRDSGWAGPSAEQFDAYMTAMTQQVDAMAESAGTISTQLGRAADAVRVAQANLPDSPPPGFNINDPTPRAWPLYANYGDPRPATTFPGTAREYYSTITNLAREQAEYVATFYDAAALNLANSQATAPTVSRPVISKTDQPGTSGSGGSRTRSTTGTRPSATGEDPNPGTPSHLLPQGGGASRGGGNPSGTDGGNNVVLPEGVDGPRRDATGPSTAALAGDPGSGSGGANPNNDDLGNWLPGGVPEGIVPSGAAGRSGVNPDRGGSAGRRSGSGDEPSGFGDGSHGVFGGTRVPSSVAGRGVPRLGRPLGEVEPGIIGGEQVGGGRVMGGRGAFGERGGFGGASGRGTGADGDGVSGGRLEASPPEGATVSRWPRSAGVVEGEPQAGGFPGGMPVGGAGSGRENERGKRPKYLKQDPEYWQSKQDVVPPVIE